MKKKYAIGVLTVAACTVIGVATSFSSTSQGLFSSKADNAISWYHYIGTPATFTEPGIKDYWTDCNGSTLVNYPGNVVADREIPSSTVITVDDEDGRYLSTLKRSYDFEDGVLPDAISTDWHGRLQVSSDAGFNSSKGLKITFGSNGDFKIRMDKSYYDAVFADPSVVSIDFDAKSNFATSNFRYTQNGTNTCYEANGSAYGHGLTTTWKTYHYTRDMYNALVNDQTAKRLDYSLLTGAIVDKDSQYIYVDNIRYSRVGYDLTKKISFNESGTHASGADFFVVEKDTLGATGFLMKINSANVSSIELTDSVHLEGTRALKIHKDKGGYACFVLNSKFMNAVPADGAFLFDMYIENIEGQPNFYSGVAARGTLYGDNNTALPLVLDGGKFYTIRIPKSLCTSDNRFLYFNGSQTIGDIYMDNFRIEEQRGDFDYDFETGYVEKTNDTTYAYKAKNNTNSAGYPSRLQVRSASAENLNVTYGGLSTEFVSQGDYSFKFTKDGGYCSVYLDNIVSQLKSAASTVSFDLYSTNAANGSVGNFQYGSGTNYPGSHPANRWVTYTFTKGQLTNDGRLFILNGSTAGDYYIDNIVINNEIPPITYTFEDGVTDYSGTTYTYRLAANTAAKLQIIDPNNVVSAFELSGEHVNEGSKALKFTKSKDGYFSMHLNSIYNELNDTGTISFDLYTTVGLNSNPTVKIVLDGMNGSLGGEGYYQPANTWVRYTFAKSQITSDGRFLIFQGSPTFDGYIDNIVINKV